MMWKIRVHKLVGQQDLKHIPAGAKSRIFKAMYKKLGIDPKAYGKALSGDFRGYWRLRVDDYRVIYRIYEQEIVVYVVQIGPRKDNAVYKQLALRLDKINHG